MWGKMATKILGMYGPQKGILYVSKDLVLSLLVGGAETQAGTERLPRVPKCLR